MLTFKKLLSLKQLFTITQFPNNVSILIFQIIDLRLQTPRNLLTVNTTLSFNFNNLRILLHPRNSLIRSFQLLLQPKFLAYQIIPLVLIRI